MPALAGSGGERIAFERRDQAAARAAVLRRSDVRPAGWTGGPIKPDLSPPETCRNYRPKQSDLVLTGAAESSFLRSDGRAMDSEVKVLRTARMVSLDWRREVLAPGVMSCQRRLFGKSLGSNAKVVSFTRIPFPRIARYVAAFRAVAAVPAGNGKTNRVIVDLVLVSRRRSELSLVTLAPFKARAQVAADERRLIRLMLSRTKV